MFRKTKESLTSKAGFSLAEALVALTILTLVVFCFVPLFANYLKSIKLSGEIAKQTQFKVSKMERLVANKGNNNKYFETPVADVPLTFTSGSDTIVFNTTDNNHIGGSTIFSSPDGGTDAYVTYYGNSPTARMVCFPSELTDDFIETEIAVVAKGFKFADAAENKNASENGYHFKLYYTDSSGNQQVIPKEYYEIRYELDGDEKIAIVTFYGGNNIISFEQSPIYIKYGFGVGDNLQYSVKVEIGAPEIILVGEKDKTGNYYYYSTSGVDANGNMAVIAKQMTSAPLTSAMNDVEWVAKGMGDDGNGGVNKYGYYVMGGDAGQVRRFWRNETTGNYYWGGDYLNNYDRKYDVVDGGSYENFNKIKTTQAMFKSIYRGSAYGNDSFMYTRGKSGVVKGAGDIEYYQYSVFVEAKADATGHKYQAVTMNNFTANVTSSDSVALTLSGASKTSKTGLFGSKSRSEYYGLDTDNGDSKDNYNAVIGWISSSSTQGNKLNAQGYKDATHYEYPSDQSLITITSVGAIQINKDNPSYYGFQSDSFMKENGNSISQNIYPQQSYTLYCGYIPFVTDLYGWKTSNAGGWSIYCHLATLGVAYSSVENRWYPTGKFGDLYTKSSSFTASSTEAAVLAAELFPDVNYQTLLNYYDSNKFSTNSFTGVSKDTVYPFPSYPGNGKTTTTVYKPGETVNGTLVNGQALGGQGQDYYITGGHEVDITTGYLSEPYAISAYNPTSPDVSGASSASNYYHTFNGVGDFGHSYTGAGLRENVTMLDVKSFHDDLSGNNISFAVGYSLSYICNDYSWSTRLGQAYNTGIVYIRAVGDGSNEDKPEYAESVNKASGRGWSLKQETNIFHQFYGIDQYQNEQPNGSTGNSALGWDTYYHRAYANVSSNSGKAPQNGYSPSLTEGSNSFGTSCHPLADTKCTTVNKGNTWDDKIQVMWGTENGTLLSWAYHYDTPTNSKITAVTKEFESYMWVDRLGITKPMTSASDDAKSHFYDYPSVSAGQHNAGYGFISTLKCINDVAYGDGYWVAVGEQGYTKNSDGTYTHKNPADYCAAKAYTIPSGLGLSNAVGSYINVKYEVDSTSHFFAWKAVKVDNDPDINITSVTYVNGVWYACGYRDANHNGVNDHNGTAYIYYSTNPAKEWKRAKTASVDAHGNYVYGETGTALYYSGSKVVSIDLTGINSMASRS